MADMIELCARVAAALSFPPAAGEVMRQLVDASPKSPASPRARRPSGRAPGRERGGAGTRLERASSAPETARPGQGVQGGMARDCLFPIALVGVFVCFPVYRGGGTAKTHPAWCQANRAACTRHLAGGAICVRGGETYPRLPLPCGVCVLRVCLLGPGKKSSQHVPDKLPGTSPGIAGWWGMPPPEYVRLLV